MTYSLALKMLFSFSKILLFFNVQKLPLTLKEVGYRRKAVVIYHKSPTSSKFFPPLSEDYYRQKWRPLSFWLMLHIWGIVRTCRKGSFLGKRKGTNFLNSLNY
jgi:hypothetical protein